MMSPQSAPMQGASIQEVCCCAKTPPRPSSRFRILSSSSSLLNSFAGVALHFASSLCRIMSLGVTIPGCCLRPCILLLCTFYALWPIFAKMKSLSGQKGRGGHCSMTAVEWDLGTAVAANPPHPFSVSLSTRAGAGHFWMKCPACDHVWR